MFETLISSPSAAKLCTTVRTPCTPRNSLRSASQWKYNRPRTGDTMMICFHFTSGYIHFVMGVTTTCDCDLMHSPVLRNRTVPGGKLDLWPLRWDNRTPSRVQFMRNVQFHLYNPCTQTPNMEYWMSPILAKSSVLSQASTSRAKQEPSPNRHRRMRSSYSGRRSNERPRQSL